MDILNRLKTAYAAVTGEQVYSRYDMQRLAKFARSKQGMKLTAQLLQQTDALTKKDVGMWRQAWQAAINVDNPQRCLLYDIYTDNLIDLHLQGCISQRVGMVKRNKYRLVGKDGKEDEKATDLLQRVVRRLLHTRFVLTLLGTFPHSVRRHCGHGIRYALRGRGTGTAQTRLS